MPLELLVVLLLVITTVLAFDFTNGFHDTGNVMVTSIVTGALKPETVVILLALLNLVGVFLSVEVALTVINAAVSLQDDVGAPRPELLGDGDEGLLLIVLSGLVDVIPWNLLTRLWSLPSSSSYALFDGLVGATIAGLGIDGANWVGDGTRLDGIVGKVILPALVSSVVAIIVSGVGTWLMFTITRRMDEKRRERGFRWGQVGSASLISLVHGTNDAQKTMGVVILALIATGNWTQPYAVPLWVKVACAVAIALGTYLGGWRIIRTLGKRLVEINSPQSMATDASSAAVILVSSHMSFALSITHVATGSTLGNGLGRSGVRVNWRVVGRMLMSWAIVLPVVMPVGAVIWLVGHLLGGLLGALAIFVILLAAVSLTYLHSRKSTIDHNNVNDEWVENVTIPRPLVATTEVADLIKLEQPKGSRA